MTVRVADPRAVVRLLDDAGEVCLELSDVARRYFNLATAAPGGFVIDLRSPESGGPQPGEGCWEGCADAGERFAVRLVAPELDWEIQGQRLDAWVSDCDGRSDDPPGGPTAGAVGLEGDAGAADVGHAARFSQPRLGVNWEAPR